LQEAFPSERREVNLPMNSSVNRCVIERVGAAYDRDLANACEGAAIAAEDVLTGSEIPGQYGRRIRAILYTGIEHFNQKATACGVA
jgi:hypothetical protein